MAEDLGTIGVQIEARLGKLDQGIRDAESKVRGAGQRIDSAMKPISFERLTLGIFKFSAAIQGLSAGFTLARVATSAWAGDLNEVRKGLEALPLGIGGVFRSLHELVDQMSGREAKDAALAQSLKRQAAMFREVTDSIDDARAAYQKIDAIRTSTMGIRAGEGIDADLTRIRGARDLAERQEQQRHFETGGRLEQVRTKFLLLPPAARGGMLDTAEAAIAQEAQRHADTVAAIRDNANAKEEQATKEHLEKQKKIQEDAQKESAAAIVKAAEQAFAVNQEFRREREQAQEQAADTQMRIFDAQAGLRETRLRIAGRGREADIEGIRTKYTKLINDALLRGGQPELFDALAAQREAEIALALQASRSTPGITNAMISRGGQFALSTVGGPARKQEVKDTDAVRALNEIKVLLKLAIVPRAA